MKNNPISIAPMMDYTDRHYRYFMRQISKKVLLYTEMVVSSTIKYASKDGRLDKYLGFSPQELPLCIQLGGNNPQELGEASIICQDYGYSEINLNVGCPSNRVQSGAFGACLMKNPNLVAECLLTMKNKVSIPISVKHRIGVDDLDSYEDLSNFIKIVSSVGVNKFIIHARKAWLQGLSPKENRTVPPLRYEEVYQIKKDFPHLNIEINGQIKTIQQISTNLEKVDGVMIGREAYENPWLFSEFDTTFYHQKSNPSSSREEVLLKMREYPQILKNLHLSPHSFIRHMMGLYKGIKGARNYRSFLTEKIQEKVTNEQFLNEFLELNSKFSKQ
ncbi:MAG: tRNA dihydrouridine(20/20a) synthase DusA [Candidatus Cloacimonadota bacterium]|nr:MAG: tRNA dihydrouridine(20/20a) synthase DusA [Candidatus Cloacimonadota bacterium]PCJ21026.1 MAG: tRNA dihydrouridine(20/20a) synthase DusA [Candidatus Cloacimonadota bacterium]